MIVVCRGKQQSAESAASRLKSSMAVLSIRQKALPVLTSSRATKLGLSVATRVIYSRLDLSKTCPAM